MYFRFWYENGGLESSFTAEQLQQIRRISLAKILCQTMNTIRTIQPFVFLAADNFKNVRVNCDSPVLEDLDLLPWIERGDNKVQNKMDLLRFLSTRSRRSTKEKLNVKSLTRTPSRTKNNNSTQWSNPQTKKIQQSDLLAKSKDTNQINIAITGLSTPLPQPIEINIKIHNAASTSERFSTVTKRRPSVRPYPPFYNPIGISDTTKNPLVENHFSSIHSVKPISPLGDSVNYHRPSYTKPLNSYNEVNEDYYQKPTDCYQ